MPHCNTSCQKILTNIPYKAAKVRETVFFFKVCYYLHNLLLLVQFLKGYVSMGHLKLYLNVGVCKKEKSNHNLSAEQ